MTRFNDNISNPGRQVLLIWLLSIILSLPVLILARTTEKIRDGESEMIQLGVTLNRNQEQIILLAL